MAVVAKPLRQRTEPFCQSLYHLIHGSMAGLLHTAGPRGIDRIELFAVDVLHCVADSLCYTRWDTRQPAAVLRASNPDNYGLATRRAAGAGARTRPLAGCRVPTNKERTAW